MFSRIHRFTVVLAVLALVAIAGTASAATPRWGADVWGGWNTFSMGDWNDVIDQANSSGANFDNINNGLSFGVGPSVMFNDTWQFGVHYERLMGATSEDQGVEVKPVANAFGVSGTYWFPSTTTMNFGLGASIDYMSLAGTISDATTELEIEGTGVGGQVMGMTTWRFTPMFSGNVGLGYRFASIDIENIDNQPPTTGDPQSEDYSGLAIRVGFSLTQPHTTK